MEIAAGIGTEAVGLPLPPAAVADAGASEIWPMPFPVGADPSSSLDRTRRFLDEVASRTTSSERGATP